MKLKRTAVIVVLFAGLIWLGIAALEPAGARGFAGAVIQNNLENQTDATSVFYTDLDPKILQAGRP